MVKMVNKNLVLIKELDREIELLNEDSFKDKVNYSPLSQFPIHRWFKYREGYSIELINSLINKKDKIILDPFCGCGSTLLSAKINNKDAYGIDINPVSAFVTEVKTQNYSRSEIKLIKKEFSEIIESKDRKRIETPPLSILEKAFHPEILNHLLKLKYRINNISNKKIKSFILLGFISIIESVSNTYKEGNGLKYRFTKRTPNGYIQIPIEEYYNKNLPKNKIKYVNNIFQDKINLMLEDIKDHIRKKTIIKVIQGDARKISEYMEKTIVDLTVFSPPYCNCFDYFEIFKLELWLGEFIKDYEELKNERKKALRSNTNANLNQPIKEYQFLERLLSHIPKDKLWNKRLLSLIRGYFSDMGQTLEEIFKVTKKNGRCIIIVGNSAYGGILIPTDILLSKIAIDKGFILDKIKVARHLTTSSQQKKKLEPVKDYLRESIICLKKI